MEIFRIATNQAFIIPASFQDSVSTDTVTILIRRNSDNYYYNFTSAAFQADSTTGNMTFDFDINWVKSFTPTTNDEYTVVIHNSTLDKKESIRLISQGSVGEDITSTVTNLAICNQALRSIGADEITSLDDNVETARVLTDIFTPIRNEVLSAHPWNFAIKRDGLTASTTPDWGYDYSYSLPSDYLRIIRMEDDEEFKVEQDKLLTDEDEANVLYIAKITDSSKYTPWFVSALVSRLAAELAYSIVNNQQLARDKFEEYKEKLKLAKSIEGQEGTTEKEEDTSWLDERA